MRVSTSKLFNKMNTFPCTRFIEEGCLALQQTSQCQTDKDIYHVIRLQRIIETIDTLANEASSDTEVQSSYLRVWSELEQFRAHMVSDVSDSRKTYSVSVKHMISNICPRPSVYAIPHC